VVKLVKSGDVYKIVMGARAVGVYDPATNVAKVSSRYYRSLAHEELQHLVGAKFGLHRSSKLMMGG